MPETPPLNQIRVGQASAEQGKSLILDQSIREQDERAGERNKYRTLAQKLFGKEKVAGVDMAMEEAMRMDTLIDGEVEKGTKVEEAVKDVSALPEFRLKGLRNIQKEEYVRAKTLQFAHALEENKLLKAKVLRKLPQLEVDDTTVEMYQDAVKSVINTRAGDLATQKDGEGFRKVIRGFGDDIQRDRMAVTDEVLKAPEIQGPIQKDLVASFKRHNTISPEAFAKDRDRLVEMGVVDVVEINQLPEIQQVAKDRLIESFMWHNIISPEAFAKDRDGLVGIGLVKAEDVNLLPEIQQAANQKLVESFKWHNTISPEVFAKERDSLAAIGVIDVSKVNQLDEIRQEARQRLIGSFRWHNTIDPKAFAKERDAFVALGVADLAEINNLGKIQQAAKEYLIASYRWHNIISPEGFAKDKGAFIALGIVNENTVNSWLQDLNSSSVSTSTP